MSFRAYLFDLDGTLVDSVRLILDSFRHARRIHFSDELPDEAYLESLGMPLRDIFGQMTANPELAKALTETYLEYNLANHDASVRAYDGIADVLTALSNRGAILGVVTSKMNENAWRALNVCGLAERFTLLVGADDVVHAKPDPEPVQRALDGLGLVPVDAVFIGDSPHDIHAGNAAGVATAAATWGPFTRASLDVAGPTFWLEHPRDVLDLNR